MVPSRGQAWRRRVHFAAHSFGSPRFSRLAFSWRHAMSSASAVRRAICVPVAHARGVDARVRTSVKKLVACLVVFGACAVPAVSAAQESVAVECGPRERAVVEQRRVNGRTQVVARCEGAQRRASVQTRQTANGTYRPAAARGSTVQYVEIERAPERSKTKTALMIAGSA